MYLTIERILKIIETIGTLAVTTDFWMTSWGTALDLLIASRPQRESHWDGTEACVFVSWPAAVSAGGFPSLRIFQMSCANGSPLGASY